MAAADLSKPLNPGWLQIWIIIKLKELITLRLCMYLNAKQQIVLQEVLPMERALE